MCIRDSHNDALAVKAQTPDIGRLDAHQAWFDRLRADCASPVSYTHLRAHETVLDLVCRLLLEKKKEHQTQSVEHDPQRQTKQASTSHIWQTDLM